MQETIDDASNLQPQCELIKSPSGMHAHVELVKVDKTKDYIRSSAVVLYATNEGRKSREDVKEGQGCRCGHRRPD